MAQFAEIFDGFSIGSNDLTQLALGVDRGSELVAPVFDERDPAVLALVAEVIRAAHAAGRRVGICGRAPSDRSRRLRPGWKEFRTMRHDEIDPGLESCRALCAAHVMSHPPITIGVRASVADAVNVMTAHRIHYLPVVDAHAQLVGIVNADDLRRGDVAEGAGVATVMASPVVSVDRAAPVSDAIRLMAVHGVGALPVVDTGRVVGILTQSDVVVRLTGKLTS